MVQHLPNHAADEKKDLAQQSQVAYAAIGEFRPRCRAVLILALWHAFTPDQIQQWMRENGVVMSRETVIRHLKAGRTHIKERVREAMQYRAQSSGGTNGGYPEPDLQSK